MNLQDELPEGNGSMTGLPASLLRRGRAAARERDAPSSEPARQVQWIVAAGRRGTACTSNMSARWAANADQEGARQPVQRERQADPGIWLRVGGAGDLLRYA